MALDEAAINSIFSKIESHHLSVGRFEIVSVHEPKSAPPNALTAAIWGRYLGPLPQGSGLDSTSALMVVMSRVYRNMLADPADEIDPMIFVAVSEVMARLNNDTTLDSTVKGIDVLGQTNRRLEANDGYLPQDGKVFRVMDITIPIMINNAWDQEQ